MYIIEDIWREIKTYLFHNIKIHGKHLKNDKWYHINDNNIEEINIDTIDKSNVYMLFYKKIN